MDHYEIYMDRKQVKAHIFVYHFDIRKFEEICASIYLKCKFDNEWDNDIGGNNHKILQDNKYVDFTKYIYVSCNNNVSLHSSLKKTTTVNSNTSKNNTLGLEDLD